MAALVAVAAVALYVTATSGPDRQTYAAMYDFGDSLLFLAVFGVVGVVPTGAALYFSRPHRGFWRMLSVVALTVAATGLAAVIAYLAAGAAAAGSALRGWAAVGVLRMLVAPMFGLVFLLAGVFAPTRASRIALVVATLIEVAIVVVWFQPFRPR